MPKSRTPETSSTAPSPSAALSPARGRAAGGRLLGPAAAVLAAVLLFVAYLQVSRTYPENSDEANILLMAWDMLHGNALLHGWYLSDVSFYPTELPQYALLERVTGLHMSTAHVAAAMTYTLVVLLAAVLARGRARAGEGVPRMLLTAGIMFAPQLGVAVFILLLSVGHIGTAVPLMLTWLVIDRLRPRWWVAVLAGLMLTWAVVADPLVLVVGIIPLVAVCAVRAGREMAPARRRAGTEPGMALASLRARWYEVSLAAAAVLAQGAALVIGRILRASGAFFLHPVPYRLADVHTWPKHAWVAGKGLLALFGALPEGPAPVLAFALVHLAGVALVGWAMWRVARHFVSWPDLVSQVLLVAIVINAAVYVPSMLAAATDLNAREFAVVLPFGAVLAGRTLADGLRARLRGWRRVLAAALLACYAASLGYAAAQPPAPTANAQLARFLAAHHLASGIGGYWEASVVTVESGGAVTVRAVLPATLRPDLWEAKGSWFGSARHRATFLVTDSEAGFFHHWWPARAALAALGRPARIYRTGPYTVYVWDRNLLAKPRS